MITREKFHKGVKRKRMMLVVLMLLVAGGVISLALHPSQNREPRLEGRTLTQWLDEYEGATQMLIGDGGNTEAQAMLLSSSNAVRQIGTNALPFLLQMAGATDNRLERGFKSLAYRQSLVRFHFEDRTLYRYLAVDGFKILGSDAQGILPALATLTKNPDREVRYFALHCLRLINPRHEAILPILLRTVRDPDKYTREISADYLNELYPKEAEKAGVYKEFPDLKTSGTNDVSTMLPLSNK